MLIGKHQLVFDTGGMVGFATGALPSLGDTVYLDTKQHRELRATLEETRMRAVAARPAPKAMAGPRRVGVLQVIAGRAEQTEYDLDAHTTLIGKSDSALVRLRGWFKPTVALAIARSNDGYVPR